MKEIIKKLKSQIDAELLYGSDLDEISWGSQQGVLISVNDARAIVKMLPKSKPIKQGKGKLKELIAEAVNTKPYENLREILGEKLGQLIYDIIEESRC